MHAHEKRWEYRQSEYIDNDVGDESHFVVLRATRPGRCSQMGGRPGTATVLEQGNGARSIAVSLLHVAAVALFPTTGA